MIRRALTTASTALLCLGTAACAVGPDYHRPSAPVPSAYKELQGWKTSQPKDTVERGPWWSVFQDPTLDALERQVDISNQNLEAAAAAYLQASAVAREAGAALFPSVGLGLSGTRQGGAGNATAGTGGSTAPRNSYELQGNVGWDLDIWGRIRRQKESAVASAQASAADLAGARLSAQANLAIDYFELRAADQLQKLLDETVDGYKKSLTITQNQYTVGVVSRLDVITAQTQLDTAESEDVNVGVQRASLEHAIAVLIGKAPGDFSLPAGTLAAAVPDVPVTMPSALLERRPDIASAERQMAAANAEIGVEEAGYFPDISLSGLLGYVNNAFAKLATTPNRVWSVGADASANLFNGGATKGAVSAAEAAYDGSVANYRQTVLTAFQGVEDQLATLRILAQQATVQDQAVKDSTQAANIALNQYRAGISVYTAVVTAQATQLASEQTALTLQQQRLTASVILIEDLGGGWSSDELPDSGDAIDGKATHR
ncbi:MAG TPA: efflux transporter outer membrane subunit [Gammaproteobacteria bacterium]|nr:efflux transporter outer membrane subunit [Gammaproteobacteria bacterium]